MAVKPCSLKIDMRQHETDNRGTPMFSCGAYNVFVGDDITECIPWHWHEEVEVIFVAYGVLKLDVPNHSIVLFEGDAVFINSSVLHTAINGNSDVCEIKSFVFDPSLISGTLESAIEQKYVRPLVNCSRLSIIKFENALAWHKEAIECVDKAFSCYQKEDFGYEMLVRDYLSRLWFLIVSNNKAELQHHQSSKNTEAVRVKKMLGYIHTHFAEPINLKNLSDSVSISERECLRCFSKILGTSPMKYLLNYRVSVASGLLTDSELNITEICKQSGFDSPSYFSLKFKSLTDMSPSEYRKRGKERQ